MSRSGGPNFLGAKYAPFVVPDNPNRDDFRVRDVALPRGLDDDRFDRRRDLRARVDRFRRITDKAAGDPVVALDDYYEQGYDLMSSPRGPGGLRHRREPDTVRDAYGRNSFGQRALLARRLVEAGVPFVTLNEGGWDHHADIFKALQAAPGRRSRRRSPTLITTSTSAACSRRRWSSPWASSAARRRSTRTRAATTGPTPCRCCSPAAARPAARSSARPTRTATPPSSGSSRRRTSPPRSTPSSASTRPRSCYTPNGRPVHLVSDPTPIRELMG